MFRQLDNYLSLGISGSEYIVVRMRRRIVWTISTRRNIGVKKKGRSKKLQISRKYKLRGGGERGRKRKVGEHDARGACIFINIQLGYARDTDHGLRNFNGIEPRFFHVSRMGPTSHEAREMAIAFSDRIDYFHAYGYATRKQITLCPRNTIAVLFYATTPSFQSNLHLFPRTIILSTKWIKKKKKNSSNSSYSPLRKICLARNTFNWKNPRADLE